jgi:hypothetical protein
MARYRLQEFLTQEIPDLLLMDIAFHWQANDNPAPTGQLTSQMRAASLAEHPGIEVDRTIRLVVSNLRTMVDGVVGRVREISTDWCVGVPTAAV